MLRRQRLLSRAAVVVVAVATALTGLTATVAPGGTAAASDAPRCADITFIGVRGSGQTTGMGTEVSMTYVHFVRRLTSLLKKRPGGTPTFKAVPVDYTAANVSVLVKLGVIVDPFEYLASIDNGIAALRQQLDIIVESCPETQLVVVGYSQGALVAHRLMAESDDARLRRVVAVGLLADPKRKSRTKIPYVGTSKSDARGLVGAGTQDPPSHVVRRTVGACDAGDIVCDSVRSLRDPYGGVAIHTDYVDRQALDDLGTELARLVAEQPRPEQSTWLFSARQDRSFKKRLGTNIRSGASFTWRAESGMPPGLSLSTDGTISGAPTRVGTWTVRVAVRGTQNLRQPATVRINVDTPFDLGEVPGGIVGRPYDVDLPVYGGVEPYTARLVAGALPPGLALSGARLAGTPTAVGMFAFTLDVRDGDGLRTRWAVSLKVVEFPRLQIASQRSAAVPADLEASTHGLRFMPDGARLLFASRATNLVDGDTNDAMDVFLKDLSTGAVTLVSTTADGTQGDRDSGDFQTAVSPDGRLVAFASEATNLVEGGSNGERGIFVKDLVTGIVRRADVTADGVQGDRSVYDYWFQFSPDGTALLFSSESTNLVDGDTNDREDVFVKNLVTGAVQRISTAADGTEATYGSSGPVAFSPDGASVAFVAGSPGLTPDADPTGYSDVYVKNLGSGEIRRVTFAPGGGSAKVDNADLAFTPDGASVLFVGLAPLAAADVNGWRDIYRVDLATGTAQQLSVRADGAQPTYGEYRSFAVSSDGRSLAFGSDAKNLVDPDGDFWSWDVFVRNLETGGLQALTTPPGTPALDGHSGIGRPAFSPDGRLLAFDSRSSELITTDRSNRVKIFVQDLSAG